MEEDEMEEDGMEDDESEEDESEEDESEEDESEEDESKEGENLEKESINFTSDKYSEKSIESNGGSITSDINNTNQEYIDSSSSRWEKRIITNNEFYRYTYSIRKRII